MPQAVEIRLVGDWRRLGRAFDPKRWERIYNDEMDRGIRETAEFYRDKIKEALETEGKSIGQRFTPLHPFTEAEKRELGFESAILQRTKQLLNAIESKKLRGKGIAYRAGVSLTKKHRPSGKLVGLIALIQQAGAVMRITPAMRRVLNARGLRLRAETKVIKLPARPFVSRAIVKNQKAGKRPILDAHRRARNRIVREA